MLHCISFNYPICPTTQDKKNYKKFILSLPNILPCKYCRDNLPKNLKSSGFNDKVFKNRTTFSRWVYRLHNTVNVMLHKKKYKTFEEVRDTYENFRSRCTGTPGEQPFKVSKKKNISCLKKSVKNKKPKKEKGCTNPLYGVKSRCVLTIVPQESCKAKESITMDPRCKARKIPK